jgi:hypothetical protein
MEHPLVIDPDGGGVGVLTTPITLPQSIRAIRFGTSTPSASTIAVSQPGRKTPKLDLVRMEFPDLNWKTIGPAPSTPLSEASRVVLTAVTIHDGKLYYTLQVTDPPTKRRPTFQWWSVKLDGTESRLIGSGVQGVAIPTMGLFSSSHYGLVTLAMAPRTPSRLFTFESSEPNP